MIFMTQRDGECSSFSSNEGTVFEGSNVYGFLSDYTTSLFLLSRNLQCKRILGSRNLVRVRIAAWVPETFHARFSVSDRLKTCRPPADEAPRHAREKISGTRGISL